MQAFSITLKGVMPVDYPAMIYGERTGITSISQAQRYEQAQSI